jgi:hypothetical protein
VTVRSHLGFKEVKGKTYTDFEDLHKKITGNMKLRFKNSNMHTAPIPALPPKKPHGDKKQRIEAVRQGLESYLNTLLSRADIAEDQCLCVFLALPTYAIQHSLQTKPADVQQQEPSLQQITTALQQAGQYDQEPQQDQLPPPVASPEFQAQPPPILYPLVPNEQPEQTIPRAHEADASSLGLAPQQFKEAFGHSPPPTVHLMQATAVKASAGPAMEGFPDSRTQKPSAQSFRQPNLSVASQPPSRSPFHEDEDVDAFGEIPDVAQPDVTRTLHSTAATNNHFDAHPEQAGVWMSLRGADCESWQIADGPQESNRNDQEQTTLISPRTPRGSSLTPPKGCDGYTLFSHPSGSCRNPHQEFVATILSPNPPPRPVSPSTRQVMHQRFDLEYLISSLPEVASPPRLSKKSSPLPMSTTSVMQLIPDV